MLISLDQIVRYLNEFGLSIDVMYISSFEQSILFISGNLLFILFCLFWLLLVWKVFSRVVNSLF